MPRHAAADLESFEAEDRALDVRKPVSSRPTPAAPARPARRLQQDVAAAAAAGTFDAPRPDRWSARQTLSFILVTCGAFWIAVGLVVSRLL